MLLIAFDTHHRGQDFVDGDLTGSVRVCRALGEEYGMLLEELFDVAGLERKVDVLRQYATFQQLARVQRAHGHPQDISPDINDRPATRTRLNGCRELELPHRTTEARPGAEGSPRDGRRVRHERSEEHTSELQSQSNLVCRLLLEKKKNKQKT